MSFMMHLKFSAGLCWVDRRILEEISVSISTPPDREHLSASPQSFRTPEAESTWLSSPLLKANSKSKAKSEAACISAQFGAVSNTWQKLYTDSEVCSLMRLHTGGGACTGWGWLRDVEETASFKSLLSRSRKGINPFTSLQWKHCGKKTWCCISLFCLEISWNIQFWGYSLTKM